MQRAQRNLQQELLLQKHIRRDFFEELRSVHQSDPATTREGKKIVVRLLLSPTIHAPAISVGQNWCPTDFPTNEVRQHASRDNFATANVKYLRTNPNRHKTKLKRTTPRLSRKIHISPKKLNFYWFFSPSETLKPRKTLKLCSKTKLARIPQEKHSTNSPQPKKKHTNKVATTSLTHSLRKKRKERTNPIPQHNRPTTPIQKTTKNLC
jgi:hypothetical protein